MTKHDVKNGNVRIANTMMESLSKWDKGNQTLRVLLWVLRNSYGYNRKFTHPATTEKIGKVINMPKSSVILSIRVLLDLGVIERKEDGGYVFDKYAFESAVSGTDLPGNLDQPVGQPDQPVGQKSDQPVGQLDQPVGQPDQPVGQPIYIRSTDNLKDNRKTGEFIPPDLVEVEKYCAGTGGRVNAGKWFYHYKANGWKIGAAKMQDWHASVDSWAYSASVVPAAASSGAPRVNPAEAHLRAMDLVRRTEAFHDRATKGGRCAYCGDPVPKRGMCTCHKYLAALGKIKGGQL